LNQHHLHLVNFCSQRKISGEANFTVPLELDSKLQNLSINGLFPCKLAVASAKDLLKQDFRIIR
jgi:hypothetical protein